MLDYIIDSIGVVAAWCLYGGWFEPICLKLEITVKSIRFSCAEPYQDLRIFSLAAIS